MIRMSLGNEPYIERDTGKPLEGRLTVYLHDTDTVATVYTLEGPDFVEAENPQLVHGGSVDDSLFAQTGIYDLRLERYIGTPGQMSAESPDSDFEQVDVLECGIDFDFESMTANQVDFVADLRNVAPEKGAVTVHWYESAGDCVPRVYVWDAASVNTEDGGYVIGSDVSDTGRWILLWDDEQLPASVYGVTPGNESNMGPLLNYPDIVGSFGLKTAPIVRFQAGTYSTALSNTTSRTLAFDSGAKFTGATFVCPSAIVNGKNTDYIADFSFSGSNVEAHSSWFRTVNSWWHCGAKRLVIDNTNYFTSYALTTSVQLEEVTIEGAKPIATTYSSGAYLAISKCAIVGTVFSGYTDYIKFTNTTFKIDWFTNQGSLEFGTIAGGQRIELKTAAINNIRLANMTPAIYADALKANGNTTIDFEGATIYNFTNDQFTTLKNLVVTNILSISVSGCDMENVSAAYLASTGQFLTMTRCKANFTRQALTSLTAVDSEVTNTASWTSVPTTTLRHCRVGLSINSVTDNDTEGRTVTMTGCDLYSNDIIVHKKLYLIGCQVGNNTIKIRPYKSGSDYIYNAHFEGCQFTGSTPVEFDLYRGAVDDTNCHDIKFRSVIVGNSFSGNSDGIKMKYWAWPSNSLKMIATSGNDYIYRGNSGNCPAARPTLNTLPSNFASYDLSGTTVYKWRSSFRAFPELNSVLATASFTKCSDGDSMCAVGSAVTGFFYMFRDRATIADDTDFFATTVYLTSRPSEQVRIV